MNNYCIICAEGSTIVELREEIKKSREQDIVHYGFPFSNTGTNYYCMKKVVRIT